MVLYIFYRPSEWPSFKQSKSYVRGAIALKCYNALQKMQRNFLKSSIELYKVWSHKEICWKCNINESVIQNVLSAVVWIIERLQFEIVLIKVWPFKPLLMVKITIIRKQKSFKTFIISALLLSYVQNSEYSCTWDVVYVWKWVCTYIDAIYDILIISYY